ncbi:competence type IV pilus assembly protein ComGB [Oceanobacillus kimchii]|uniref:competence type IV pilus assembly protein ComGB n=1 Tax=Oceanobacillus kimchii TaxID=746691 RepID=UPI00098782BB|nr:competence type IV pilus assembly protein ComGB [Oceanobacillus kimchii]
MALYLRKIIQSHKLSSSKQLRFLQILSRMLSKGLTISESLETLSFYDEYKHVTDMIKNDLKNGLHLDEALENVHFHHSIVTHLYVVRDNGNLESRIKQSIHLYQNRINYQKRFQQVVRYPLILIITFSIILYFVYNQVLSSFQFLFVSNLSPPLQLIFFTLQWAGYFILIVLFLILIAFVFWSVFKKKISTDLKIKIISKIPLLASYYRKQTSFHFATQLSSLLQAGMSFHTLLSYMAYQDKLPIITYYSKQMHLQLARGKSLESLLTSFYFIEKQLRAIMSTRVDAKTLAKDLHVYAELSMEEMYYQLNKIITYIQPIFFIIVGAFIIFIYISVLSPMFEIMNSI